MSNTQRLNLHRQQGAVLLISLILLLIMTFLSVAMIDATTMESQMVRAMQWQKHAYQTSLSELNHQTATIKNQGGFDVLFKIQNSGKSIENNNSEVGFNNLQAQQSSSISYIGVGTPEGSSIDSTQGLIFMINSKAEIGGTGGRSDQSRAVVYTAPSG